MSPFKIITGREMKVELSTLLPSLVQGVELQKDVVRKRFKERQKKGNNHREVMFTIKDNRFWKDNRVHIRFPSTEKRLTSKYSVAIRVKDVAQATVTTKTERSGMLTELWYILKASAFT